MSASKSLFRHIRKAAEYHRSLPLSEQFRREWIAFFVVAAAVYLGVILAVVL